MTLAGSSLEQLPRSLHPTPGSGPRPSVHSHVTAEEHAAVSVSHREHCRGSLELELGYSGVNFHRTGSRAANAKSRSGSRRERGNARERLVERGTPVERRSTNELQRNDGFGYVGAGFGPRRLRRASHPHRTAEFPISPLPPRAAPSRRRVAADSLMSLQPRLHPISHLRRKIRATGIGVVSLIRLGGGAAPGRVDRRPRRRQPWQPASGWACAPRRQRGARPRRADPSA